MKHLTIFMGLAGLFVLLTSNCFAAQGCSYDDVAPDFKHSNKVTSTYYTANSDMDYAVNVKHTSGNRFFATTNNSNIVYKESDTYKGKTTANLTSTAGINASNAGDNTTALGSDWHEL